VAAKPTHHTPLSLYTLISYILILSLTPAG
jgi:hypothetical protein